MEQFNYLTEKWNNFDEESKELRECLIAVD